MAAKLQIPTSDMTCERQRLRSGQKSSLQNLARVEPRVNSDFMYFNIAFVICLVLFVVVITILIMMLCAIL